MLGSEHGTTVEAKTAAWQRFTASSTKRKARGDGNSGKVARTTPARQIGVRGEGGSFTVGASDGDDHLKGGGDAGAGFVCWVCRRSFKSRRGLEHHESMSELHMINMELQEFLSSKQR